MNATFKMTGSALLGLTLALGMMSMGCGEKPPAPPKNSGTDGAQAAKEANQKASTTVKSDTSKGTSKGSNYDGTTCDSSLEGIGWCANDEDVIICFGGNWYQVNCPTVLPNSYCGVSPYFGLDCWVDEEAQQ